MNMQNEWHLTNWKIEGPLTLVVGLKGHITQYTCNKTLLTAVIIGDGECGVGKSEEIPWKKTQNLCWTGSSPLHTKLKKKVLWRHLRAYPQECQKILGNI